MLLVHLLIFVVFPSVKTVMTIIIISNKMVENISDCGYYKNRSWNGLINTSKAGK